jgi:hypothetical protein
MNENSNNLNSTTQTALPTMIMPPSLLTILCSDQFPDILQNYSNDNCRLLLNLLLDCLNNPVLINKKGDYIKI